MTKKELNEDSFSSFFVPTKIINVSFPNYYLKIISLITSVPT